MVFFFFLPTAWGGPNGANRAPIAQRDFNTLFPLIFLLGWSSLPELALPLAIYMLLGNSGGVGGGPHDARAKITLAFLILLIVWFFPRDSDGGFDYDEPAPPLGGSDPTDLSIFHTFFLAAGAIALAFARWDDLYRFFLVRLPMPVARVFRNTVRRLGLTPARNGLAPTSPEAMASLHRHAATGDEGECSVCLDRPAAGQRCVRLGCAHVFHEQCIATWLAQRSSCPVCRRPVDEPDLGDETPLLEELRGAVAAAWEALKRIAWSAPSLDEAVERNERARLMRLGVTELKGLARSRGVDVRGAVEKDDIVRSILAARA